MGLPGLTRVAADGRYPSLGHEIETDFRTHADGALPALHDTGQALNLWDNGLNASTCVVSGGKAVKGTGTGPNAGIYAESATVNQVKLVGAKCNYAASNSGQIALINWQTSIVTARNKTPTPDPIPNGAFHFVASQFRMHMSIWVSAESPYFIDESYPKGMRPGTDGFWDWQVLRIGSDIYIGRPDGSVSHVMTDPLFSTYASNFASWELYDSAAGMNSASFVKVWAQS